MPRANRHYLPGYVWHITHRCHKQEFLLKFVRDRQCWIRWLFEAKKRYGLCVLNYIATSNHIHLLVQDTRPDSIAQSMQLIAGRTAQEYNQRKCRKGAYWEDRYFATAIDTQTYLAKCLTYIDLNMVRAGVVTHPEQWKTSGYHEIQNPGQRYRIINTDALKALFDIDDDELLKQQHKLWVDIELQNDQQVKNTIWSQSLAVGGESFVKEARQSFGARTIDRKPHLEGEIYYIKEPEIAYRLDFDCEIPLLSA